MENKYKWLAAQIDNIYRECSTVNMNGVAKLIQDTIERPEPLLPGVRYRNTDKNRARIPKNTTAALFWLTGRQPPYVMYEDELCTYDLSEYESFALIPDGEVQDE
jgi:hypothetical protein